MILRNKHLHFTAKTTSDSLVALRNGCDIIRMEFIEFECAF